MSPASSRYRSLMIMNYSNKRYRKMPLAFASFFPLALALHSRLFCLLKWFCLINLWRDELIMARCCWVTSCCWTRCLLAVHVSFIRQHFFWWGPSIGLKASTEAVPMICQNTKLTVQSWKHNYRVPIKISVIIMQHHWTLELLLY